MVIQMSVGGRHLAAAPPDGERVEKVPEACEKGPGRMNSDELSREEKEDEVCQISLRVNPFSDASV